jgi:hypothetical protein
MSVAVAAIGLLLGVAPAQSQVGKSEAKGQVGSADQSMLQAEAAAGKAAAVADPGVNRALSAMQSRIANFVRTHGTGHSFGSFIDPASGKIVIETDAPAGVVSSVVGTTPAGLVQVRHETISDSFSRRDDTSPFWGGAGVVLTAGSPRCSTGFSVQDSDGTRSMVTAGHCFSNGANVVTEVSGTAMGSVSGNGLPSQDMELIGGKSYGSSIYVGGVDSTTSLPVVGSGDPVVGFSDYCHSGRTTGENCGHKATSVTAQVCTSSGCKSPVIAFTGGTLPQGGDSGSPFYVKNSTGTNVWARGIVIAGDGTTSYAEKWSRISARFDVSIVT